MIKYFKIGNRDDTLSWFAQAPNREMAIKVVEDLMGPQNPSRRIVVELPSCPEGYTVPGTPDSQILTESEE
jgi:hypothetical protein